MGKTLCYRLILDEKLLIVLNLVGNRKRENEDFANSMSNLIKWIKLNNQEAKSNGQLEGSDADAIPFTHLPLSICNPNWQFVSLG